VPLVESFREIARLVEASGDSAVTVDVAILPSLCEVRLVSLPPLRHAEAEAIIRRDANKHFTVTTEPRVISVRMPKRTRPTAAPTGAPAAPVLAASVSQNLLDDINTAAEHVGWSIRRIVPAHAAWLHLSTAGVTRESSARPRTFIAIERDTAYITRIQDAVPVDLRRVPATHTSTIVAALGTNAGTALLFGADATALSGALAGAGWSVLPVAGGADAAAARGAAAADMTLMSATLHARRYAQQRTLANRLWAAAAALVIVSAAVAHWGARHELEAVRARRAAIRPRVAPLLAMRDSVDALETRTRETDAIFASQSHWSKTLYEITMLLPEDAHLTQLNATGDTIVIEGEAARAGVALEALSRAPSLRNVQLEGPVQRDLADGTTTAERFTIQGTLASAVTGKSSTKKHVEARKTGAASAEAAALGQMR
jgi:Tfp pilus assembly protein PilN